MEFWRDHRRLMAAIRPASTLDVASLVKREFRLQVGRGNTDMGQQSNVS